MNQSPKIFFRTNHNYAVNNKDNNYRVYYGKDKNGKEKYFQCKDKKQYQEYLTKYICGFFDYSRNEEKAKISMFDYYTGAKKSDELLKEKQMKREQMMMLSNGKFATDEDSKRMQKTWARYLVNSNVHQMVLSFNNDYINENIEIEKLQKEVATKIMPMFLKKCGYQEPQKNIDWVVSLHCDTDNFHFHISCVEKRKCYLDSKNQLSYKRRLEFTEDEQNFFKRQTAIVIEREKLYKPALIKINKELEEFQSYFSPKERNFILINYKKIDLEEKILKLGFLLNEIRNTDKKYIKYNSLPKNEIGDEIRNLTKEVKNQLFKDTNLLLQKKNIMNSIDELNEIFKKIDIDNNISKVGFESALDNQLIQNKLERTDNYVLNAIVNHALYKTKYIKDKLGKENITFEDLLNELALSNYKKESNENLKNKVIIRKVRIRILRNHFQNDYVCKKNITNALSRIGYEQKKAAEQFYEMFGDNEKGKAILER